jgi:hypothetical protein
MTRERTSGDFGILGRAATGIVNAFDRVHTTWQNTNVVWGLSLNALHWIVMGSMELLAVAVPAIIAFGGAAAVAMQGANEVFNRLQSGYTVTESLGGAFNTTGGQIYGMGTKLQDAQDAADPMIWEALGGGIAAVNARGGEFVSMGTAVIGVIDRWIAAFDVELKGAFGGTLTGIVSKGTQDLTAFGQVFGNLGHFIANVAAQMPGLAEVMLGAVAGFTDLLKILTNPAWSIGGISFITLALGIEESWRWGGMLAGVLARVIGTIGKMVGALAMLGDLEDFQAIRTGLLGMESALGAVVDVLSGPWGWVIMGAIAGLTLLTVHLLSSKTAAQQFADGLENAVNSANVTDAFTKIGNDLGQLQTKMQQTGVAADHTSTLITKSGASFKGLGGSVATAVGAYNTYSDTSAKMIGQSIDIIGAGEKISSQFKLSLPAAFLAADQAGLQVGSMFQKNGEITATALQQVENYLAGYRAMSGTAGALSNNIDAVNVQIGLQDSKVAQLNQAWDQFIANATGGTSAWASLQDDLQQLGNTSGVVGDKISAFKGTVALAMNQSAKALQSFSGTSAQVWQNYDASLTQANTVTDWWRTAAASGAVSGGQLTAAIATTVKQLLPFAQYSKTAVSELSAIAQQAGGPATSSFTTLKAWVDKNAESTSQYNKQLQDATGALSNVNQQAQQFSQTLQGDVSQAIITGSGALAQVTQDTETFTKALKNNNPASDAVKNATIALTDQLVRDGYDAKSTASMIYQLTMQQTGNKNEANQMAKAAYNAANALAQAGSAASRSAGAMYQSAGAMDAAENAAWRLNNAVRAIPTQETINVAIQQSGSVGAIVASVGQATAGNYASGYRVPGYGGGDVHPALLEGGEAVVPKHLTPAVAPFLKAHGVPGFAAGGYMGSSYGGAPGSGGEVHVYLQIDGRTIAKAMLPALVSESAKYGTRNSGKVTGLLKPS